MADSTLELLADALAAVPGVAAITLGGSRARGTETPSSDFDLGLYYHRGSEPKAERLREALRALIDEPDPAVVTEVGEWGPWIVGGAWITAGGAKVDLLYRCVEAVSDVIRACREGRVSMDYQPGHPHGFSSAIWMGEVALCRPLHDPDGLLEALKAATAPYPTPLRAAIVRRFQWEALFSIENAKTAVDRDDLTHIAGCAYRALGCAAQVLFALNGRYLINEKGAIQEAATLPITVSDLVRRVLRVWQAIGRREPRQSLDELRAIERELRELSASARDG